MKLSQLVETTRAERKNVNYSSVATERMTINRVTLQRIDPAELYGVDLKTGDRTRISLELYNDILFGRQNQGLPDLEGYEYMGLRT